VQEFCRKNKLIKVEFSFIFMKIGIIGPSKIDSLKEVNPSYENIFESILKEVLDSSIFITPDKGSVSEDFSKKYLSLGGKKIFSVIPMDDSEFGSNWVNKDLGKIINCGTWRNQPEKLNEETEAIICLGYSVGGLIEIAYSKWFNKKPIYIVKELVSGKLPKEVEKGLDLRYVSYKKIGKIING
jgi:hypothetical protein